MRGILIDHSILAVSSTLGSVSAAALDVLVLDEAGATEERGELMELLAARLGLAL
jgi:hypothetical protein